MPRPWTVSALSFFFGLGAAISALAAIALLLPGGWLDPLWRLNPRALEHFAGMGIWAVVLMVVVSVACLVTSVGLWRGRRFGYVLGLTLLTVSMLGDLANATLGHEPRAWLGVPISALLIAVLATSRASVFFGRRPGEGGRGPMAR
jgi:hypothetical protein